MGLLSGSADNRSAGTGPASALALDALFDWYEWHAEDPAMRTRAMNGKLKTMQEMLARAIGPATTEALHGVTRAAKRDTFTPGAQRSLQKALHRVCSAPSADERLSFRPVARSRAVMVGCR
jgi:hypothetical protein